jgi:Protein of unknown function (DUF3096)
MPNPLSRRRLGGDHEGKTCDGIPVMLESQGASGTSGGETVKSCWHLSRKRTAADVTGIRPAVALRAGVALVLIILAAAVASPAAQFSPPRALGAVTLSVTNFSPLVALIAGILILIVPRLLNYIVAVYLILVGLFGLMGR